MSRSVVFRGATRCPQCQVAPRWCVCEGARTVALPFELGVLMHHGESHKPTSTGNLIRRVVPASRRTIYHNQRQPRREDVFPQTPCEPPRATWILHPRGDAIGDVLREIFPDSAEGVPPAPMNFFTGLQVLLIDGTWAQATDMLRHADGWGQKVSLPATALPGGSRYWLRSQHRAGHFSTAEALMALLGALGFERERALINLQFELHVYACLLARGRKAVAAEFLRDSPLGREMPGLVAQLGAR